jgi:hypothetical protein
MREVKSLAAEIEAVLQKRLYVSVTPAAGLPATKIVGIPAAAAEIAALQSRAFEDGAQWMREKATDTADYARERAAMALHGSCDGSDTNRTRRDLAQSLKGQISALPLQPEGESDTASAPSTSTTARGSRG